MRRPVLTLLAVALSHRREPPLAAAATEADFKTALAAAEAANKEAGALSRTNGRRRRKRWPRAKKAAEAHKYDEAVELAKHAEALAKASIYQAKEQEEAWKAAVIR